MTQPAIFNHGDVREGMRIRLAGKPGTVTHRDAFLARVRLDGEAQERWIDLDEGITFGRLEPLVEEQG